MTPTVERRAFRRVLAHDGETVSARIRPGRLAAIIDICPGGASIEVPYRLLPGAAVELQLDRDGQRIDVKGRIVRCAVVRLRSSSVTYRAAIAFDAERTARLDAFVSAGHQFPAADARPARSGG
jgi:hypothetical protein